jgi:cation transport ATPase
MKSDPHDVVGAIELSRATLRKMHQKENVMMGRPDMAMGYWSF